MRQFRSQRTFITVSVVVIVTTVISGCAALPRRRFDTEMFGPFTQSSLNDFVFILDDISVTYADPTFEAEYPLEEIIINIGKKNNLHVMSPGGYRRPAPNVLELSLTIWVKEDKFIKDLTFLRSITAVFTCSDYMNDGTVLRSVYNEESIETVESFYHFYSILDSCIREISHELNKQTKKRK